MLVQPHGALQNAPSVRRRALAAGSHRPRASQPQPQRRRRAGAAARAAGGSRSLGAAGPRMPPTAVAAASASAPGVAREVQGGGEDGSHVPSSAAREMLFGVGREQAEVEAEVSGQLPAWLEGSLLVNGGGDYSHMRHMFDGYALVSKVRVQGGKAWGSQRFLDTKAYSAYRQEGRVVYREFDTRPEVKGLLGEAKELLAQLAALVTNNPIFTDNASVSLQALAPAAAAGSGAPRVLLAMSETPAASYLLDPADLRTVKQVEYDDGVPGSLTTAHPSIQRDGSLVNFSRSLPFGGFHLYRQDPGTLRRTQVAYVPDRRPLSPAWVHDFAATERHAVVIEHPLYMSLASLLLGTPTTHLFMDWAPEDGVLVHLVPLDGSGAVRTFTCPAFFFFHVGNAFESEDGGSLHVDVAAYDDPQILHDLSVEPLLRPRLAPGGAPERQVSRSRYARLTLPLGGGGGGKLEAPKPLVQQPAQQGQEPLGGFCEFPQINPAWRGLPYRYAYCLSAVRPTNMGNALSKVDVQEGSAKTWHSPAPPSPLFVARPGGAAEDDGVVVAPGVDAGGRSFMVVLDAGSWEEVARVTLPFGTPNRFHGIWLAGAGEA